MPNSSEFKFPPLPEMKPGKVFSMSIEEFEARAAAGLVELVPKDSFITPEPPPVPPRRGARDIFRGINEQEAKRLGLERVEIEGSPAAQDLIMRICDRSRKDAFDVTNDAGQKAFTAAWKQSCPTIPPPDGNSFWYLKELQSSRIISNLDPNNPQISHPSFDQPRVLWMQDWQEGDCNNNAFQKTTSPLFQDLLGTASVVNISREKIDAALWIGDPSTKQLTPKHEQLIKSLGLNPNTHNFRLIRHDEYARLAGAGLSFGKSSLWTWFDDYHFEGGQVHGLLGGDRVYGGASNVDRDSRDFALGDIAVRLVLECNK
jgi:hypothetical protein